MIFLSRLGTSHVRPLARAPKVPVKDQTQPTSPKRKAWRIVAVTLLVVTLLGGALAYKIRRSIPPGMEQDIRAGLVARKIKDPDQRLARYLELRYGPLTDPANRQKAFLDFFELQRIEALQLLVKHSPEAHRQANIDAMARWVAEYRTTMTPAERTALRAKFQTPEGAGMMRKATAQYNSQDVQYRGMTAPVISQLLNTIASVQGQ